MCIHALTPCNAIANRYHLGVSAVSPNPSLRATEIQSPAALVPPRGPAIPCLSSRELFGPEREILIQHGNAYYRLRITHNNKLILTK